MIKLLTKEKHFKKDKESLWLDISLYWKLTVCFMFLVFLLASFFGYYLFMQINKDFTSEQGSINSQVPTVKKESIDKVLQIFSTRAQKSNQILNSPTPVIDPSL